MEIMESKSNGRMEIIISIQGEILYIKPNLEGPLKNLKIGKNVSNLVDMNYIQKLSMFSDRIDVVPVRNEVYKQAMVTVFSKGYGKFVKLTFLKDAKDKADIDWIIDKKIITTFGEVTNGQEISLIDFPRFCEAIKATVKKEYYFLNIHCQDVKFYNSEAVLQTLILNSVAIMYELCPKKSVDLFVKQLKDGVHIKIMMNVDNRSNAVNWQQIEKIYPWMALRVSVMDEACEQRNIYNSAKIINNVFTIEFIAKEMEKKESELFTRPMVTVLWSRIAESLKPRPYILAMHDMQAKEQEE